MKRSLTRTARIGTLILLTVLATCTSGGDHLTCPVVTAEKRPALLFVEGPVGRSHLWITWRQAQSLHRDRIISGRNVETTRLNNTVFLISVTNGPADRRVYAANLNTGRMRLLLEGKSLHCLRSEPDRKAAILLTRDYDAGRAELIELNLDSLRIAPRYTLSRDSLGEDFDHIDARVKISPDFTRIAYFPRKSPDRVERWSEYELRLLDLATMNSRVLDPNVGVEISLASSFAWGMPVLEWTSDKEILYRDMIPSESDEVTGFAMERANIFKVVNIETGHIAESFRKMLPLTLDGGSLKKDPVDGRFIYNDEFVLDLQNKLLTPKNLPFAVVRDYSSRTTSILREQEVLYRGPANCVNTCVSASRRNFAYALRERGESLDATLHAEFASADKPLQVAAGPYLPTRAVAWIE